ncbi:MAG TPA: PAS domain S-box protein, partial [Candidatus Methanoperedens sp.]|nr:PAS domain S-box protein [Candidatus Methanoperedens sp.]
MRTLLRTTFASLVAWAARRVRRSKRIVVAVSVALCAVILALGWLSYRSVKEVVTEDFNQQQLVLAQYAARQISHRLAMLRKELGLLGQSPALQYQERVAIAGRLERTFMSVKDDGAVQIRYVAAPGTAVHVFDKAGYRHAEPATEDTLHLLWATDPFNRQTVLVTPVTPGPGAGTLLIRLVYPVWQDGVDEAHPTPTRAFAGALVFVVDVAELTGGVTRDIRSGKTGYAWVIDSQGTFLHHQEASFIGKNAFAARTAKMPTISFARINEIQKTLMLTGKEGTSWYISGWHLGVEGKVRKLIAYAPIRVTGEEGGPLWSVAVVAPISEVEGAIHAIQVRGMLLQATIIAVFIFGTVVIISLMARWSADLEREVSHQTAELTKSEQRYRSLVENAGDAIFTADRAGTILSMNASGAKLLRTSAEQLVGRNLSQILTCPTAEEPLLAIDEVFQSRKGRQVTHLVKIGERELWLNTNFRRLLDEEGNIYAVLGIARDITDRRLIEEQSYNTEKLASLGTLAAGVAHEINNPLTVILGFVDLLLEKAEKGSETEEALRTIETYGSKARKVVENLLTFARRKEHSEDEVDINACLEAVLAVLGNYLLVNRISIRSHALRADLPAVRGDADELQQVFLNIINNARQAIEAHQLAGRITLTTTVNGDRARVT